MKKVLLTGVTGFLGSHTTIQLLNKGYEVIGTLRDIKRAIEIKSVIASQTDNIENLYFQEADLLDQNIWNELTKGIDFVQHIASPFPRVLPDNDEELVKPAVNGVNHVMKAAAKNGVKRVVLTSSIGAIIYGKEKGHQSGLYTEKDWTNEKNIRDTTPYFRSKTLAEKAAWDFIKTDDSGMELSVICPGAILGPVLEKDFGTSANIVIKLMNGSTPAIPRIGFDTVDVRSVADLHILAMEKEAAANERFVGSEGFMPFNEVADILRIIYTERKIPKLLLPNFMVRFIANFDKTIKPVLIDLGVERKLSNKKAKELLGWKPLENKEAVISCADSVIKQGLV